MNIIGKKAGILMLCALLCQVLAMIQIPEATAAESSTSGRKLWDTIMLFVNFGILVWLFLRYGKKPLMEYIHGIKEKTARELGSVEARFDEAESAMEKETEKFHNMEKRLMDLRENILEIGRQEKEKIIHEGRIQGQQMIKSAEDQARYRIAKAREALKDEMIDMAVSLAGERLAEGLTDEDNDKLVDDFIVSLPKAETDS